MNFNKTISILGCGWLGFDLAKQLIKDGFVVKGSTTSESKMSALEKARIHPFLIDLNKGVQNQDLSFFDSDILFLNIPPGRRNPVHLATYPDRIEKALRYAKAKNCKNCILVSSTGVFESQAINTTETNFPIYDLDSPNGSSQSAQVLIEGERQFQSIFQDSGTLVRFGGLVGSDRIAGRFLAGKKNLSNSKAPVNMIHKDDCIQIIRNIITGSHWGKILNAVSDLHPSREDFYTSQAKKCGFHEPTFTSTEISEGKIINNKNFKTILDYQFLYPDPMGF